MIDKILLDGAKELNVDLTPKQIQSFLLYKETLKEWNAKINLTAILEDQEIMIKHFLDSLTLVPVLTSLFPSLEKNASGTNNPPCKIIDVGTGGGFPGIPLKIALDALQVTLFDSLDKRVKFLTEMIRLLELQGIEAVHGRAEEFGVKTGYREAYDIAVARAVANLPVLLEYCLPFVKVGGIFIAMKGSATEEIGGSSKALEILGGKIEEIKEVTLPFSDFKRNIIVVRKLRQLSSKYPRKAGKPSKEPLV